MALAQLATNCIHKNHGYLLPLSLHADSRYHPPLGLFKLLDPAEADWPDRRLVICPNLPPQRVTDMCRQATLISGGQGAVTRIEPAGRTKWCRIVR
jgi:hypothetical protein